MLQDFSLVCTRFRLVFFSFDELQISSMDSAALGAYSYHPWEASCHLLPASTVFRSQSYNFLSTLRVSLQMYERGRLRCFKTSSVTLLTSGSVCMSLYQLNADAVHSWISFGKQIGRRKRRHCCGKILCSSDRRDALPTTVISTAAKIRSEVLAPFRSVRMFFYLAFIASASIGGLIAMTRLIAALRNTSSADQVLEILQGLGIDIAAVVLFVLLYRSDAKARDVQLAKLSREESLALLRLELSNKRIITVGQMRGTVRVVIIAGPGSYIEEALRLSKPYQADLVERGVLVVPYATDGSSTDGEASTKIEAPVEGSATSMGKSGNTSVLADLEKRWKAIPIYTSEWSRWLDEQKRLANVPEDKPVYISLRLDGRVRGSGVGLPPWGAFVAQLPPLKGMWAGAFDGMDGRI
ncbi:hypothetical protein O6H91_05G108600 [Diphasiastrum complanatum]|uniref:Uncharacterized protein n=1 Tax=Diphasiastrum complanatum TaxID=34168 RepID=A0ACC2DS24_DIPCM|nr:hypothetical protein O6H91_05G108600 [Diphasiastrum complanatum]